jgi:hypothetical protein
LRTCNACLANFDNIGDASEHIHGTDDLIMSHIVNKEYEKKFITLQKDGIFLALFSAKDDTYTCGRCKSARMKYHEYTVHASNHLKHPFMCETCKAPLEEESLKCHDAASVTNSFKGCVNKVKNHLLIFNF